MSLELSPEELDSSGLSIKVLSDETKNLISTLLNPEKIIPSDKGLLRDWRGLAELCCISGEKIPNLRKSDDPSRKVLEIWLEKDISSTIGNLLIFLEDLDRFDIKDDITPLIEKDVEYYKRNPNGFTSAPLQINDKDILTIDDVTRKGRGLPPQIYDAFVLFAEDDIDFVTELLETMENQYNLKLCVKHRDLVGGTFEHNSMIQLITNRCGRLLVVLSPSFLESDANKFLCNFAQVQGIEQRTRKIVPILYKDCKVPPDLGIYFLLDFVRLRRFVTPSKIWDKLYFSIINPQTANINKSVENLRPTNHVRFNSMININVQVDAPTAPLEEPQPPNGSIAGLEANSIVEKSVTPTSSYNNLEPYSTNTLKKKRSIYESLKRIIQPSAKNMTVQVENEEKKEQTANGVAVQKKKKKKKLWKLNKTKEVAVAH